jgi:hypothetical protein
MKKLHRIFIVGMLLLTVTFKTFNQIPPAQVQGLQQDINEGRALKETYNKAVEKCREAAHNLIKNIGNDSLYNKFREARANKDSAAAKLQRNRDSIITGVVTTYGITLKPGQQIGYDKDCKGECVHGYCSVKCPIGICEKAFQPQPWGGGGTPGWIAAIIKHEAEHKNQINPGPPPSWKPEYDGKDPEDDARAEYEAWQAALKCAEKSGLTDKEKDKIKQIKEYWEKKMNASKDVVPDVGEKKSSTLPGEIIHKEITVTNYSNTPQMVHCTVVDSLGWTILPNEFSIVLGPEQETRFMVNIQVPPEALPGVMNEMFCYAESDAGTSSDFTFFYVIPTVDIVAGSDTSGMRGSLIPLNFTVKANISSSPDSFRVEVTNPLDWPVMPPYFDVYLLPGEEINLASVLMIPPAAPYWTTNLVSFTATSKTDTVQRKKDWLSVEILEVDVGTLLIESPLGVKTVGSVVTPKVWIYNSGHVESFFDIFTEIDIPPLYNDSIKGIMLLPHSEMLLLFKPLILTDAGTFNIKFYTRVEGGDANPANDTITSTFTVGLKGITVASGWNMISVPYAVPNPRKEILFPTSQSNAFAYIVPTGYEAKDSLNNGEGYWLKFSETQQIGMVGDLILRDTFNVVQGWNMIGSISADIPIAAIVQNPPNIVASNYYSYKSGYKIAETIEVGNGYWIKAKSPGELILSTEGLLKLQSYESINKLLSAFNTLIIKDTHGNEQVLYFGVNDDVLSKTIDFELPPLAPSGTFDVRYESNKMLELHNKELEKPIDFPILLNGAASPLSISWEVAKSKSFVYRLCSYDDGKLKVNMLLKDKGSIKVNRLHENKLLLKVEPKFIPTEFALYQNYPNPFNPSTKIVFDLPFTSRVDLKIYNILGQEVVTICDKLEFEEGRQEVEFFSTKLASGVYFYRINAEFDNRSFTSVKKMLYMK